MGGLRKIGRAGLGALAGGIVGGPVGAVVGAAGGYAGGGSISNAGKAVLDPGKPDAPAPALPLPDEDALAVARRRRLASTLNRSGRSSTIMTDTLG